MFFFRQEHVFHNTYKGKSKKFCVNSTIMHRPNPSTYSQTQTECQDKKGKVLRLTLQQDRLGGGEELVLRAAVTTIGSVIFSLIKLMLFLDEREFSSKKITSDPPRKYFEEEKIVRAKRAKENKWTEGAREEWLQRIGTRSGRNWHYNPRADLYTCGSLPPSQPPNSPPSPILSSS